MTRRQRRIARQAFYRLMAVVTGVGFTCGLVALTIALSGGWPTDGSTYVATGALTLLLTLAGLHLIKPRRRAAR